MALIIHAFWISVVMLILAAISSGIGAAVMSVRASSNERLTYRQKAMWIIGQLAFVPLSAIYMFVIERQRGWKIVGALILLSWMLAGLGFVMLGSLHLIQKV